MRIAHVIASCNPADGGPVEGVFRLADAFRELGSVSELVTLDLPSDQWVGSAPMPVHALGEVRPEGSSPIARAQRWARYSPAMVRWLRDNVTRYDGVIVDGLWNFSTHAARRVLPGSDVPYVVFPHGMLDPWFAGRHPAKHVAKSLLWQVNEGPLLRNAKAVAFTTAQERDLARQAWKPWHMRESVVGYGTAEPPAATVEGRAAIAHVIPNLHGRDYLLFLSRLHHKKGCDLLLEGFARSTAAEGMALVMAGPGESSYIARLKRLAADLGVGDRVIWPGMLEGEEKWATLRGCSAMALTSHQENFGVVVAEALACGRPAIVSDQVNIHNRIDAADAGLVCRTEVDSVASAISKVATMPRVDRTAMGVRGRALFEDEFRISQVAERLINLLR